MSLLLKLLVLVYLFLVVQSAATNRSKRMVQNSKDKQVYISKSLSIKQNISEKKEAQKEHSIIKDKKSNVATNIKKSKPKLSKKRETKTSSKVKNLAEKKLDNNKIQTVKKITGKKSDNKLKDVKNLADKKLDNNIIQTVKKITGKKSDNKKVQTAKKQQELKMPFKGKPQKKQKPKKNVKPMVVKEFPLNEIIFRGRASNEANAFIRTNSKIGKPLELVYERTREQDLNEIEDRIRRQFIEYSKMSRR